MDSTELKTWCAWCFAMPLSFRTSFVRFTASISPSPKQIWLPSVPPPPSRCPTRYVSSRGARFSVRARRLSAESDQGLFGLFGGLEYYAAGKKEDKPSPPPRVNGNRALLLRRAGVRDRKAGRSGDARAVEKHLLDSLGDLGDVAMRELYRRNRPNPHPPDTCSQWFC